MPRSTVLAISQQAVGRAKKLQRSCPLTPGFKWGRPTLRWHKTGDFMLVFTEAAVTNSLDPRDAYYRVYRQSGRLGWF